MSDLSSGSTIGPWELLDLLGEGGNAEVWRCADSEGHVAAVKFLKTRKSDSNRWERFRREVDFVAGLGEREGIVPIEAFDLPEAPGRKDRAWYSMPVAINLPDALAAASLSEVAAAFVALARTLAEIGSSDGVAHRDIKPSNLYVWQGEPAVGDFGLLWRPDMATLSLTGEIPGAFSFTAPELFREDLKEDEINYEKSDVFSLAKTLWAVARGQDFAVPGEHRASDLGSRIDLYRPDANASALNRIIELATVANPDDRPTMAELAGELEAWNALQRPEVETPDLSGVAEQIRQQLEPAAQRNRDKERLVEFGQSAVRRVRERLTPLFNQLDAEIPGARTNFRSNLVEGMARTWDALGMPQVLLREVICAGVSSGEEPLAFELEFGVVVELLDDGNLCFGAAMSLGYEGIGQHAAEHLSRITVRAGSVDDEDAINKTTAWIIDNVQSWLKQFADEVSKRGTG